MRLQIQPRPGDRKPMAGFSNVPSMGTRLASLDRGDRSPSAQEWLVDAYNVIHVTLLGGSERKEWWKAPMRDKLIERSANLPPDQGTVWLIFDGTHPAPTASEQPPHLQTVFAASADEWIVQRIKASPEVDRIVVTADRALSGRSRHWGARVISPGEFIAACTRPEGTPNPRKRETDPGP